jgi:hypothetical protein
VPSYSGRAPWWGDEPVAPGWPTVEAFGFAALEPRLLSRSRLAYRTVAPFERCYGLGLATRMYGEPAVSTSSAGGAGGWPARPPAR